MTDSFGSMDLILLKFKSRWPGTPQEALCLGHNDSHCDLTELVLQRYTLICCVTVTAEAMENQP